ncbi:MAG: LysR family transcriptional regulator [Lachnospiraceae bacterium]|nr:LysR family transcriptional regulator [Lachnospiraceae bacterium]
MEKINANVFLKVAETGSFRKAAEELGYTQAGISYIISSMEEETGLSLFLRERNGVKLSPEGKALLPHIKQYEIWEFQLKQAVNDLKGLNQGTLRVLIFNSISIHWIPDILSRFLQDYPHIHVELITEENSERAEQMVHSGEVDCGFFFTKVDTKMDLFQLKKEKLFAVVAPDHPLAELPRFPMKMLDQFPYIDMSYHAHSGIWNYFEENDVHPTARFTLDNDNAAMSMVSKGFGYAVFAELILQDVPYDLRRMEFEKPATRTISIGTRSIKTCSNACREFIRYTREWVKEHS